jgi:fatty acid desaturase
MARRSALRASDSDREQVAERLRHATAEGRLLASELEDRLGAAFSSRTYDELDALVADLPEPHDSRPSHAVPLWARAAFALAVLLAVLAVVAVVALVVAGLFATWALWVALGWLFFRRVGRDGCGRQVGLRGGRGPGAGYSHPGARRVRRGPASL